MALREKIRSAVSTGKEGNRFRDGDFDLPLTYIANRILLLRCPGPKKLVTSQKGFYDETAAMLKRYHLDSYLLLDFVSADRPTGHQELDQRLLQYGHLRPSLDLFARIAVTVMTWFQANPAHVVVLQTQKEYQTMPTLLAVILCLTGLLANPREALEYVHARTSIPTKVVTTPSDRRCLREFVYSLQYRSTNSPSLLWLNAVILSETPVFSRKKNGLRLQFEIWDQNDDYPFLLFTNMGQGIPKLPVYTADNHHPVYLLFEKQPVPLFGDFRLRCFHVKRSGRRRLVFSFFYNTAFMDTEGDEFQFPLADLDTSAKPCKFGGDDFKLALRISRMTPKDGFYPSVSPKIYLSQMSSLLHLCEESVLDFSRDTRPIAEIFHHVQQFDGLVLTTPLPKDRANFCKSTSGFTLGDRVSRSGRAFSFAAFDDSNSRSSMHPSVHYADEEGGSDKSSPSHPAPPPRHHAPSPHPSHPNDTSSSIPTCASESNIPDLLNASLSPKTTGSHVLRSAADEPPSRPFSFNRGPPPSGFLHRALMRNSRSGSLSLPSPSATPKSSLAESDTIPTISTSSPEPAASPQVWITASPRTPPQAPGS
jgi:hypothetical protein